MSVSPGTRSELSWCHIGVTVRQTQQRGFSSEIETTGQRLKISLDQRLATEDLSGHNIRGRVSRTLPPSVFRGWHIVFSKSNYIKLEARLGVKHHLDSFLESVKSGSWQMEDTQRATAVDSRILISSIVICYLGTFFSAFYSWNDSILFPDMEPQRCFFFASLDLIRCVCNIAYYLYESY